LPQATFYRHKQLDRTCADIEDDVKPRKNFAVYGHSGSASVTTPPTPSNVGHSNTANELSSAERQTPAVPSSLLDDTDNVAQAVQDLQHVSKFINQSVLSLSYTNLVFDTLHNGDFISMTHADVPNTGPCKLRTEATENASILAHERNMFQALIAAQSLQFPISLESTANAVLQRINDELQRVDDIKAVERERQRFATASVQPQAQERDSNAPVMINTGKHTNCRFKINF
jgi:hypothetical protein